MKILHIISQIPSLTGSGIYLQAIMQHAHQGGYENCLLAGVPADFDYSDHCGHIPCGATELIRFGDDVDFHVVGMSDVMPYRSTRFCDLSEADLIQYQACFDTRLQQAVARWQPDIIHSHHLWLVTSLTRQRFPHIPLVASCHGSDLYQFNSCCHLQQQVLLGCSKVDAVCALSHEQKQRIIDAYQIDPNHIHVVGTGFNSTLFHEAAVGAKSSWPVQILYVGKLSRAKGVPWLLKALQDIERPDWHLHLVGDGSGDEKDEIVALCTQLGGRVTMHGTLKPAQLAPLMKNCHLFVLPSFFEGIPLVVMEALACGCRVITTSLPGINEVFSHLGGDWLLRVNVPSMDSSGQLRAAEEEKFLAELTVKIVHQLDVIGAGMGTEQLPAAVKTLLKEYAWHHTFDRIEKVYRRVISQRETDTAAISS